MPISHLRNAEPYLLVPRYDDPANVLTRGIRLIAAFWVSIHSTGTPCRARPSRLACTWLPDEGAADAFSGTVDSSLSIGFMVPSII
jgi:hypothetical protein